jgi:hypothetical protein
MNIISNITSKNNWNRAYYDKYPFEKIKEIWYRNDRQDIRFG